MPLDRNPNRSYLDSGLESRVQSIEDGQGKVEVQLAEQAVTLSYLKETMDGGFRALNDTLKPFAEKVNKIDEKLDSHDDFIMTIKEERKEAEESKKDRKTFWSKILLAGLTAIASAGGLMLWENYIRSFFFHG